MNRSELVAVRDGTHDDINFILATWLRGLYYGDSIFSNMVKDTFMHKYHTVLENILASPNTVIRVACLRDDPGVILGYAVMRKDLKTIDFVFVKKVWRGIGIAKQIIPSTVTSATHFNKTGLSLLKSRNLTFDPFLL